LWRLGIDFGRFEAKGDRPGGLSYWGVGLRWGARSDRPGGLSHRRGWGVFGSGIRFVWRGDLPKDGEGAEGALIHEVKAGFVAVEQG
jgi:hypothetical protein